MALDALIQFYEELTAENLVRLPEFYAEAAYFKDPFNEVVGAAAIQHIFADMFRRVSQPRFVIMEPLGDGRGAMLVWEFHFRARLGARNSPQLIRGVSYLRFDAEGRVRYHRDYWDPSEELYMKLPGLGILIRGLRKLLRA
ncbi:MAG TPA: nuclear transport factor 2 family protein [Aromatoleum sp.]|uniref:nuclear transport factor 2 family protein n=1 Tax=Aromatoleum sp. TaxID=2307007 RepID=UPI002B4A13A7|nr:nuclear transport factor 2 family protein [Aromatoleum sp.]HJV25150.1 nuclear transport factor 2 family protein [Aromatoleum sp.]